MKKLLVLLCIPMSFLFVQCNSGEEDEKENDKGTAQTMDLGNVDEIDMEEHGFQILVKVPAAGPTVPEPMID